MIHEGTIGVFPLFCSRYMLNRYDLLTDLEEVDFENCYKHREEIGRLNMER